MRTLGIVGGTSWHSTATYYRLLNEGVARRRGGLANAPLILENIDFEAFAAHNGEGRRAEADRMVVASASRLAEAGADAILLASNTMHRAAAEVAETSGLSVIDIRVVTAARLVADGIQRFALLGTRSTMTEEFASAPYREAGLSPFAICEPKIAETDRIIFDELVQGRVTRDSQRAFRTMLSEFQRARVEAVVLGCTELAMAIDTRANILPVYDTTALHAEAAVRWLLGEEAIRPDAAEAAAA